MHDLCPIPLLLYEVQGGYYRLLELLHLVVIVLRLYLRADSSLSPTLDS